jgi:hypothetical protein
VVIVLNVLFARCYYLLNIIINLIKIRGVILYFIIISQINIVILKLRSMARPLIAKKSTADTVNSSCLKGQGRLETLKDKLSMSLSRLSMNHMRDLARRVNGSRMDKGCLKRNVHTYQTLSTKMQGQENLLSRIQKVCGQMHILLNGNLCCRCTASE